MKDEIRDSWELDEPYRPQTLEEIREHLLNESGFRQTIVDRALKRLDDVVADGDGRWLLAGRPELGDNFPIYTVRLDNGRYSCTCYGHHWGSSRRRRICSHVIGVIVARRLNKVQVKPASQRLQLTPADLKLPAKFTSFRQQQLTAIDRIRNSSKRVLMLQGPTGCHRAGQGILMFDGRIKPVQHIRAGDLLMGPDGCPRRVLQLIRGKGPMMEIQPVKGKSWVVNQDHVLTLVHTSSHPDSNGETVDVTVREWLTWSKSQKHLYKLFRVPLERSGFKVVPTGTIEPFFGFVLDGDGRYLLDDFTVTHNSGKSLIAAAAQRIFKERFLYCCINKGLQAQFKRDLASDLDGKEYAVELKGRANYPTLRYSHLFPKINASMCTAKKETHCRWCCDGHCNPEGVVDNSGNTICFAKADCPYRIQKAKALRADLAVVNTALFLNEANFVGQFSGWPWMVIDETDRLEGALMDFIQLEITRRWIDRLNLEPPARKTVETAWIDWAEHIALPAVNEELAKLKGQYGVEDMRREQELERMQKKLAFFLNEIQLTRWVFIGEADRWTFKPVFVSKYADRQLWRHASRFILMSATIISPDEMAHSLGIPRDEIEFIDLPSTFPPERRPIYYLPRANITKKTEAVERPKAIAALDEILDKHPNDKALVHTVSYGYAQQVYGMSRHKKHMITYDCAQDRESKLEEFKKAPPGAVLVASSMDRGLDLPGDLCRVVVVMKFPYLNLGDKQISTRLHSDKKGGQLWFTVNAIRTLVQMTGRASRSADDYCEIYILDEQFGRVYRENKFLFPQYWREALKMPKP